MTSVLDASCPIHAAGLLNSAAALVVPLQLRESMTLRAGTPADLSALEALECRAFTHDRISRRSFLRFLSSPTASLIVADCDDALCGYALVLLRARSRRARLYSIAVDAGHAGRQLGAKLLAAAETAASGRGADIVRLEVCERNAAARNLYRRFGYRLVERLPAYYEDGRDALRLQKRLNGPALS
jgi:ribosomal protein S18 acetylase RimI-like enzyme